MRHSKIKLAIAALAGLFAGAFTARIIIEYLKSLGYIYLVVFTLTACEDDFTKTPISASETSKHYVPQSPERVGDNYVKTFNWKYAGEQYTLTLGLPVGLYDYYTSLSPDDPFEQYVFEDSDYLYIDTVGKLLYKQIEYKNFSEKQLAEYLLAFVQSFPYVDVEDNYKQYLITTLYSSGDCDNMATALVSLYAYFGINSALILVPHHMFVGVACQECDGHYISQNNQRFYIAEPTSNKPIGHCNDDYKQFYSVSVIMTPERVREMFVGNAPLRWLKEGNTYQINIRADEGKPLVNVSVNGKPLALSNSPYTSEEEDDSDTPSYSEEEDDSDVCSSCEEDDATDE